MENKTISNMENWKERFRNQFVDTYGEKDSKEWRIAYQPIEELEDFISQELDKARGEGKKELIKEIRESVKENIKIDDTEEKHIKIDTDIVKILNDKEITKMFLDGKEGEDIDWDCYGGWGWYS